MDDQLLVRLYNVGLGDCIYLRVPDGAEEMRHILIDCGNKFSPVDELVAAIKDLKGQLPPAGREAPGKKRLDLLVATHSHEDHIRGFDARRFADLKIDRIWMSAAMDRDHPQAPRMRSLHEFTQVALAGLRGSANSTLSKLATSLLNLSKDESLQALRQDLPKANKIKPVYVHAGTKAKDLRLFKEKGTKFRVLAPMADIDGFYLGRDFDALDDYLGFSSVWTSLSKGKERAEESPVPANISAVDFQRLRQRLLCNALAFALEGGHLVNNTSVVLLLEWRGRRLLFTGDAEVKTAYEGRFREGKSNGSWNVMWAKRKKHLTKSLDFLKVGHHGSENATPWTNQKLSKGRGAARTEVPHPINAILDSLLPVPTSDALPEARAVVSTERSGYKTIPSPALMEELGKRVANHTTYEESQKGGYFVAANVPQPQRTDLESRRYVDVTFAPAT